MKLPDSPTRPPLAESHVDRGPLVKPNGWLGWATWRLMLRNVINFSLNSGVSPPKVLKMITFVSTNRSVGSFDAGGCLRRQRSQVPEGH